MMNLVNNGWYVFLCSMLFNYIKLMSLLQSLIDAACIITTFQFTALIWVWHTDKDVCSSHVGNIENKCTKENKNCSKCKYKRLNFDIQVVVISSENCHWHQRILEKIHCTFFISTNNDKNFFLSILHKHLNLRPIIF